MEEDLKSFFELNIGSTKEIATVWEAHSLCPKEKQSFNRIKELEGKVK